MMNKKNLTFFFPTPGVGGNEKNFIALVNGVAKINKFNVSLVTYRNINKDKELNKIYKINTKVKILNATNGMEVKKGILKYLHTAIILLFFCMKNKTTIVSFQKNLMAIIVAKLSNNKIIIRLCTDPSYYIKNNLRKNIFSLFFSLANIILVNSRDLKKETEKYFNLNCIIFRQSLNIDQIKKKAKVKINFTFFKNYKGLKIINIGHLADQKDQITLLNAFSNLIKVRNSRLLIIGEGPNKQYIENFITKKKLSDFVKIIPFNSNPFKYVRLSDVKVLTSKHEGNPNILLETACLKKTIISSNCKVGPNEILQNGKGGSLFKVGDHRKLLSILKNLNINSKSNKKMIEISYKYVKSNFKADICQPFMKVLKIDR